MVACKGHALGFLQACKNTLSRGEVTNKTCNWHANRCSFHFSLLLIPMDPHWVTFTNTNNWITICWYHYTFVWGSTMTINVSVVLHTFWPWSHAKGMHLAFCKLAKTRSLGEKLLTNTALDMQNTGLEGAVGYFCLVRAMIWVSMISKPGNRFEWVIKYIIIVSGRLRIPSQCLKRDEWYGLQTWRGRHAKQPGLTCTPVTRCPRRALEAFLESPTGQICARL